MDTSYMKNIVILKDLPSNLVDEAIIFLRENTKQRKLEISNDKVKKKINNSNFISLINEDIKDEMKEKAKETKETKESNDYIVNEAKLIVSDYISKEENKYNLEKYLKLKKKCKKTKKLNIFLSICFFISIILNFII